MISLTGSNTDGVDIFRFGFLFFVSVRNDRFRVGVGGFSRRICVPTFLTHKKKAPASHSAPKRFSSKVTFGAEPAFTSAANRRECSYVRTGPENEQKSDP